MPGRCEVGIRIRVSTGRKESALKQNGEPSFGSFSAGAAICFEVSTELLNDPESFVAKVRAHYALCESAMNEELRRLKAQSNGQAPTAAAAASPAAGAQPAKRPAVRQPVATSQRAAAAQVDEEIEEYQEEQARELPEDDDPPLDGKHLLGWARNQPTDAKGWLIGFGRKKRYPNRILDWTPVQVKTAYDVFRQANR
jgi:hypothetical protein